MLTIRAMSDGSGYSERHLQHSDYYAEGERVIGAWQGRGAELLKLSGEVESEQFEAVRQGLDPNTGEFLRQRHSADRIGADGNVQSRGRNLYDFTISAPKSLSVRSTKQSRFITYAYRMLPRQKIPQSGHLREWFCLSVESERFCTLPPGRRPYHHPRFGGS